MKTNKMRLPTVLLLAAVTLCPLAAVRALPREATLEWRILAATACRTAPRIDGILDDECWNGAVLATDFALLRKDGPAEEQTSVYVTYDSDNLYIAFRCDEPDPGQTVSREEKRDALVCHDDCVDMFLDLNRDYKNYFHFIINPNGVVSDASVELVDDFIDIYYDWDPEHEVRTSRTKDCWVVEFAIPFSELMTGIARPTVFKERKENERCAFSLLKPPDVAPGAVWNINLCRRKRSGAEELSSWAPCCDKFYSPYQFGHLVFAGGLTPEQLSTVSGNARHSHSQVVREKNAVELLRLKPVLDNIDSQTRKHEWTTLYRRNMFMGVTSGDGDIRIPNYARRDGQGRTMLDEAIPPLPEATLRKIIAKRTPRYVYDDKSLSELRGKIEKDPYVAAQWAGVKHDCDELLSTVFRDYAPCDMQHDRNCVSRAKAKNSGAGYGLMGRTRSTCALAYGIAGDPKYARKAWEAQQALMAHFEKYQAFRAASNWYSIWDPSCEMYSSTYTYDMIAGSGVLSREDKVRFIEFIRRLAYSVDYCVRYSAMVGNHQYMWTGNFGCMVSYFPEMPESRRWANDVEARMPMLYADILADGGQVERSPGHHIYGLSFLCRYVIARKQLTGEDIFDREYDGKSLDMTLDWMAKICTPLGEIPAVNDSKRPTLSRHVFMLDIINRFNRGDYLEAGKIDLSTLPLEHLISKDVKPIDPPFTSALLPETGWAVMRDDWARDSRYLLFDYGPHGAWHGHYDKMNIIMYADGEPWVLDAGASPHYCVYIEEHNEWHKQTIAHNTVLVDGESQEDVAGTLRMWRTGKDYDLVSASHNGYRNIGHTRTVFHPRGEYFIISDHLTPTDSEKHDYSWLLHIHGKPDTVDTTAINFTRNDKGLLVLPASPAGIKSVGLDKGLCIGTTSERQTPERDDGTWTPGDPGWGYIPYISLNKESDAREVSYIVVLYPYKGETQPVVTCEQFRDESGNALAMRLYHNGLVDIYGERKLGVAAPRELVLGGLRTDAKYFFIRIKDGNVLKATAVGGTYMYRNGSKIEIGER